MLSDEFNKYKNSELYEEFINKEIKEKNIKKIKSNEENSRKLFFSLEESNSFSNNNNELISTKVLNYLLEPIISAGEKKYIYIELKFFLIYSSPLIYWKEKEFVYPEIAIIAKKNIYVIQLELLMLKELFL